MSFCPSASTFLNGRRTSLLLRSLRRADTGVKLENACKSISKSPPYIEDVAISRTLSTHSNGGAGLGGEAVGVRIFIKFWESEKGWGGKGVRGVQTYRLSGLTRSGNRLATGILTTQSPRPNTYYRMPFLTESHEVPPPPKQWECHQNSIQVAA